MIKSITVTNHLGESVKLELGFPERSGFLIQRIDGLGPSKATINSTEIATNDGSLFNSARVTLRNIVLTLKLMASPTVEDTRQKSYKYFPIKKQIRLVIETTNRTCEIYGYVEANEPDIFNSSVTTQISILCPDPYFYSVEKNITIFSGIESLFEFPFAGAQDMVFGTIKNDSLQTIRYEGDAEVGMTIMIHAFGPVSDLIIYNTDTREMMKIDSGRLEALTGSGIVSGDDIVISTVKGDKRITLIRGGIAFNILNSLDKDTNWFQLVKGDNIFAYTATLGADRLQFRIENQTLYEGI